MFMHRETAENEFPKQLLMRRELEELISATGGRLKTLKTSATKKPMRGGWMSWSLRLF